MAATIDDAVNEAYPPGEAATVNVIIRPKYAAGMFLPDGSQHIATLAPQTMAPPVSFDFPKPQVFTSNPFLAR